MPIIQLRRRPLGAILGFVFFFTLIVGYLHFGAYPARQFTLNPFKTAPTEPDDTLDESLDDFFTGIPFPTTTSSLAPPPAATSSTDPSIAEATGSSETTATLAVETPWKSAVTYVQAIMDPSSNAVPRLDCPSLNTPRYSYLKPSSTQNSTKQDLSYVFALDLRTVESLLPRLLGSVVEVIRFLGVGNCLLSIVEGPNTDNTSEILKTLSPVLKGAGITHEFASSDLDTSKDGKRVEKLAMIRNKALEPLTQPTSGYKFVNDATAVFMNDVAICPNDILELIHQKQQLGATMTCAMDWTYVGRDPTFYDVWVARTMAGDTFFNIPPDGSWDEAWHLFWNNPETRERFDSHRPFQVFSCWNGAVAFTSRAVVGDQAVKFRGPTKEECTQGEPQLFCKDLWLSTLGKIAVVPTVNLEYDDEKARQIKAEKGYTSQWTALEEAEAMKIEWVLDPPEMVKCMPGDYKNQEWRVWYEGVE